MQGKIYLDLFFLTNVLLDFIVLHIASSIAEWNNPVWKEIVASLIGGVWAVFEIMCIKKNSDSLMINIAVTYILLPILMVWVVIGTRKLRKIIRAVLVVYVVTFVMAGIFGTGWYYWNIGYGVVSRYIKTQYLLGMLVLLIIVWLYAEKLMKMRKRYGRELYKVVLKMSNQSIVLKGLLDTGNVLQDPYTGAKVNIVCKSSLKDGNVVELFNKEKYRLVPFQSVGQSRGLLPVFDIPCMEIYQEHRKIYCAPAEIGVCEEDLSGSCMYDILLHSGILS